MNEIDPIGILPHHGYQGALRCAQIERKKHPCALKIEQIALRDVAHARGCTFCNLISDIHEIRSNFNRTLKKSRRSKLWNAEIRVDSHGVIQRGARRKQLKIQTSIPARRGYCCTQSVILVLSVCVCVCVRVCVCPSLCCGHFV